MPTNLDRLVQEIRKRKSPISRKIRFIPTRLRVHRKGDQRHREAHGPVFAVDRRDERELDFPDQIEREPGDRADQDRSALTRQY